MGLVRVRDYVLESPVDVELIEEVLNAVTMLRVMTPKLKATIDACVYVHDFLTVAGKASIQEYVDSVRDSSRNADVINNFEIGTADRKVVATYARGVMVKMKGLRVGFNDPVIPAVFASCEYVVRSMYIVLGTHHVYVMSPDHLRAAMRKPVKLIACTYSGRLVSLGENSCWSEADMAEIDHVWVHDGQVVGEYDPGTQLLTLCNWRSWMRDLG